MKEEQAAAAAVDPILLWPKYLQNKPSPLFDRYILHARPLITTLFGWLGRAVDVQTDATVIIKISSITCAQHRQVLHQTKDVKSVYVAENIDRELSLLRFMSESEERKQHVAALLNEMMDEEHQYVVMQDAGTDWYAVMMYFVENQIDTAVTESLMRVWYRQLVCAIQCLHAHHIAHLDISVENVCINPQGQVKLIDFGVAVMHPHSPNHSHLSQYHTCQDKEAIQLLDETVMDPTQFECVPIPSIAQQLAMGQTQALFSPPGKTHSIAPELYQHRPWNAYQADSYSLGLILYHMLTGRAAYQVPKLDDAWFEIFITGQWTTDRVRKHPQAHKAYGHLSAQVMDLLSQLITSNRRLTPAEILQHPWLNVNTTTKIDDEITVQLFINTHAELFQS